MMMLVYFFCIFLSLFILYAVARHDFVLLRQSISLRQVYDNVFLSLFFFFLAARVGYAFYVQSFDVLHPLRFFYLGKYWGVVPYLGFVGMVAALMFFFWKKKNKLRILDIYFISFSPVILLDVLMHANNGILLPIKIASSIVLISFYGWFIKIHNKYTTKDGFITFMTVITYSLVLLALSVGGNGIMSQKYIWYNAMLLIVTIISSVLLFLIQKNVFNKQ